MINPEKSMEEFRAASKKLGDGVGVKSLIQSMGLGMMADQLGDLKLEELLSTPPPGTDEIVAISKAIIKLDNDGSFYIKNLGKTTILVNNKEVQTGQSQRLHSNCLIEDEDAIEVTPGLEIGKTLQLMCARRRLVNLWESFLLKLISPRIPQNNKCDPSVYGVLYLFRRNRNRGEISEGVVEHTRKESKLLPHDKC
ncbi:uncharacterized protein [Arachis hypogaea]